MNTKSEITIYEKDGDEYKENERLGVMSHWNKKQFVIIKIGAKEFTVSADDLKRAIDAAQLAHLY